MKWFKKTEKPDSETDEELLRQYAQSGELAVLARLFGRHTATVYYVCNRYLQDGEQSRDAVMQIFEELITRINHQQISNFSSWLYVVSRNYCLMQLRAAKKMPQTSIEDFMELPAGLHHDGESEEREQQLTVLERCMEKLPPAQKQSIDLFFINGRCYKEITDITGYSLNDVKSYIQNGKRNLKICVEKNGGR